MERGFREATGLVGSGGGVYILDGIEYVRGIEGFSGSWISCSWLG